MSPRTGRPTADPKRIRLEIRLTESQAQDLEDCANELGATKTDVIIKGVRLVKAKLWKKKK